MVVCQGGPGAQDPGGGPGRTGRARAARRAGRAGIRAVDPLGEPPDPAGDDPSRGVRDPVMETARIAQILDEMGTLLELRGENPFRCRAYHTAAQTLGN